MKQNKTVTAIILQTMKEKKLLSAGILLTVCLAIVIALLPPLVLARGIDLLAQGENVPVFLGGSYFLLLACTAAAESAREGLLIVFGQKITHALRSSLMDKFVHLTTKELTAQEPGKLASRFVGDVDTVENLFTSGIISMFADACKIISILVIVWIKNKGLACIVLVLLPFLFWFTRHVQKNMLAAQIENRKAVSRASGYVPETLHNIRTIHCLGKETYMEKRYDTFIGEGYKAMERTNFYDAVYSPVILILNAIVVAVVMLFSASANPVVLTFFGMSAGTAVAVMNYISQIFTPVESLGMEIQTIQSALAGIKRINDFLQLEELPSAEGSDAEVKSDDSAFIRMENVTFGYDDKEILKNFSLSIQKGGQVTLAGRTGAGKSTIFKLLLGLYRPKEGQVTVGGKPVSNISEAQKRKLFGYVEQSFHMVPGTVRDQITLYDKTISEEEVLRVAELTGLGDAISRLDAGFDTICTPELFSQGQWQLLSIARAAVAEPEILLLDEITASLDAGTEQAVLTALEHVSEDRTVISISHRENAKFGRVVQI